MGILSNIDRYVSESYIFENYNLTPVDYEEGVSVSFEVDYDGDKIADIKIAKIDGESIDAVNDTYEFSDVYADVSIDIEGKEDMYDIENVKKWTLSKLAEMGYDQNPAFVNGDETSFEEYKVPEEDEENFDKIKRDVEDIEGDKEFSLDDIETTEEI